MERIKIYMNTPSWNVGINTDIRLQREMACLEKDLENVNLYFPKSKILSLPYNIDKVCGFIKRKILGSVTLDTKDGWVLRHKALYNEPEIWFANCDIIYAQGILPNNVHGKPILLDLFYMRPEDVNPTFSKKAQENFDILSNQIKELARTNGIFNLRSDYAIRMVEELCPDNAWKFRNLPFLRPNIKAASTDEITEKHTNDDTIRFLFCGAHNVTPSDRDRGYISDPVGHLRSCRIPGGTQRRLEHRRYSQRSDGDSEHHCGIVAA